MKFEEVLPILREGGKIKRAYWNDVHVEARLVEGFTKPMTVMVRREDVFPVPLSDDSIYGEDWEVVDVN